ncbi:Abi-alpha family protein [uncultured Draconibacterium sp.]|uniref:Abi-alpha family protein n=1 Tax=uncultured Draconibacterium sp. TaxID=1573823 RepID=UPI0025D8F519|nr:Abi-alpha family protein [uncultured Draconibacterium sp.]
MTPEELKQWSETAKNFPIKEMYNDLLSPSFVKAGEALGTLMEFGTTPILPLKLLNARARLFFHNNIKRYERKLDAIEKASDVQVPEYIGMPILEKFTYLNDEYLAEMFANLLVNASFESTLSNVHPRLLTILETLSSDEAKILFALKERQFVPLIDVYITQMPKLPEKYSSMSEERKLITMGTLNGIIPFHKVRSAWNLTILQKLNGLSFPENIDLYIENLELNGLIRFLRDQHLGGLENEYSEIENEHAGGIEEIRETAIELEMDSDNQEGYKYEVELQRGYFEFTDLGNLLLKACIKDIEI